MSQNAKYFVDATFRFTHTFADMTDDFLALAGLSPPPIVLPSVASSDLHKESRIGDIFSLVINVTPWHTLGNLYGGPVFLNKATNFELHEGLYAEQARFIHLILS